MTDSHSSHTKNVANLLKRHRTLISPDHSTIVVRRAVNPVLTTGVCALHVKPGMLREARRALDYIGTVVFDRYILNHRVSLVTFVTIQPVLNMYTWDIDEKQQTEIKSRTM